MSIFQDKVIIVTGASEGIGGALCLALAPQKPKLAIAARNQSRLDELPDFVLSEIHRRAFGSNGKPLGKSPVQEDKMKMFL